MNDNKTERLCDDGKTPAAAQLRREVKALLAARGGIDEHKAKRLRKQWELRQSEAGKADDGKDEGADQADHTLAALFAKLRARVHAQVELRDKQFAALEAQLAQLRADLEKGDVKQSQQLEQSVINALNRITGLSSSRRQTVITELETLRPKLRKLASWRKWGTGQAREKMIAEIKGLHQPGASLAKIAQRIQQARKEWQQWDAAGEGGDKKLYAVFDRACSKAYEPCQAHFDKQKKQRRENSRSREQVCALLEREFEEVEWRDPPWKKLQQLLQTRKSEWRKSGQAEFKQRKPLQRRFDAIIEKFSERLDRERQRNRRIRENLIAEVAQLAERTDTGAALAELRELKKTWAPTVPCSRGAEQGLWKRFTGACDRVYAKRDVERKAVKQTLQQNLAAKEALCAEIEAGDDAIVRGNLGKWKAQWGELGEVPKAAGKKITARYRKAVAGAEKVLAEAGAAEAVRLQGLLREKSLLCAGVEGLALAGAGASAGAGVKKLKDLNKRWESLAALPDELEQAITERYQLASAAVEDADALRRLKDALPGNLEALHERLLELEILLELDSPAEFSRQRMALQIGRLSAAMGKGDNAEAKSAEELVRGILLAGAVDAAQHGPAFERLDRCLNAGYPSTQVSVSR